MSDIITIHHDNIMWVCPICKREFKWFEVLDTREHRMESLAPHLFLSHSNQLRKKENTKIHNSKKD